MYSSEIRQKYKNTNKKYETLGYEKILWTKNCW